MDRSSERGTRACARRTPHGHAPVRPWLATLVACLALHAQAAWAADAPAASAVPETSAHADGVANDVANESANEGAANERGANDVANEAANEGASVPAAPAVKPPFQQQVWLDAGFLSYHFEDRDKLNAYNWGFGAAWRFTEDFSLVAGTYHNSMRDQSTYAALAWQPLHLGPFRLGLLAGVIRGYPDVNNGGWFPMALPVISVEYGRVGVNLVVVPSTRATGTGSLSFQIKVRVW